MYLQTTDSIIIIINRPLSNVYGFGTKEIWMLFGELPLHFIVCCHSPVLGLNHSIEINDLNSMEQKEIGKLKLLNYMGVLL